MDSEKRGKIVLPSSKWPKSVRSVVRFVVVGTLGMLLQDGIYRLCLYIFRAWCGKELMAWVDIAFAIGFVVEMIVNFFCTAYYTFESKPNLRNAGGFVAARALNLVLQYAFLHLFIHAGVAKYAAGFPSIFLAGIINFFVLQMIFKVRKNKQGKEVSHGE